MRLGGPTVALLANESGGLLGDIPNIMPGGVMAAPRLVAPPSLPRMNNNRGGGGGHGVYSSSPGGLTLGLPNLLDGSRELSQTVESEGGNTQQGQGNAGGGGGGGGNTSNKRENSKNKGDEEYESRSGSDNMDGSGEDQDNEPPRKKRYHRHTPHQIQEMEALFKECPHPDDKQRQELSRELGLQPRQVKFWFQNRRTQLKAQQERAENSMLRMEIEKLRADNVTMREAIKNASCPNCGGPATLGEMSFDEQQLRIDNARLKDELDRVSTLAAKYLGRPIPQLTGSQAPSSSLDLAVGQGGQGSSIVSDSLLPLRPGTFSEAEKPLLVELAVNAMEELYRLCQPVEPSWIPSPDGPKEVLNYDEYIRQYQSALGPRPYGMRTEATRETDLVMMNGASLVEILMDSAKWVEIFPSIVSRAATLDVISTGLTANRNGALQLMYAEMQVLSPLVPTREMYFLRYCKQHADGIWAVVDVSFDGLREIPQSANRCRRRPSGYLIQDMPNGYSKVTVLEHVEYDDRSVHRMYKSYVNSGLAFGAQRWLLTLQRQCERLASLLATSISARDLGVIPNATGRRCMLKLAQRMTNNFCAGVSASTIHTWTTLSGSGEDDVRVMTRKSIDNPGEPHGIVLSAATSLWLPVPPKRVFEFLRDERLRNEWDILSNGGSVQEMAHIAKGQDPGNSVSLLRVNTLNSNHNHNNMLILQESCTDESGSLVVYAPVDIPAMNLVMQGGDPQYVALLPSGFAILPDGQEYCSLEQDSLEVDRPRTPGALLTVAFQILVSNVPSAKLSLESVTTVNNLITCTVQKIKAALQCDNP